VRAVERNNCALGSGWFCHVPRWAEDIYTQKVNFCYRSGMRRSTARMALRSAGSDADMGRIVFRRPFISLSIAVDTLQTCLLSVRFHEGMHVKKWRRYRRSRGVVDAAIIGFSGIQFANKEGVFRPDPLIMKSRDDYGNLRFVLLLQTRSVKVSVCARCLHSRPMCDLRMTRTYYYY
jgi:hypothetical protein